MEAVMDTIINFKVTKTEKEGIYNIVFSRLYEFKTMPSMWRDEMSSISLHAKYAP